MKKIMIAFAWTVCVLTACDKNKPSQTEMQALPVDVAKPLVENVTLTKDYPGYLEAESTVDLVGRVNGTLQSKNFARLSRKIWKNSFRIRVLFLSFPESLLWKR